ncbi:SMI1/KNR4 family protein [Succinivibrio dextrinosolvens]|uniref:SMI1/KNR4 family protein n=1 Tax=Succinivibrio dextrinosolvens TaxID=83771 RepID=UPI001921A59E|nr:SMI1/KNR4 family protein [Succinivibrio dextrinosolvens]
MSKLIETINALPNLLTLTPASTNQITEAEIELRVSFSKEYKEYLETFGAIIADGIELTGITNAEHRNVVIQTLKERNLNNKIPNTLYVIENPHIDGIIIWQDSNGAVYKSIPNTSPIKIYSSLDEYVESKI